MPNTTVSQTALITALHTTQALRDRVTAVIASRLWAGDGPVGEPPPLDAVMWGVVTDSRVPGAVREAMDDEDNANIYRNIDAISDELLEEATDNALARLKQSSG